MHGYRSNYHNDDWTHENNSSFSIQEFEERCIRNTCDSKTKTFNYVEMWYLIFEVLIGKLCAIEAKNDAKYSRKQTQTLCIHPKHNLKRFDESKDNKPSYKRHPSLQRNPPAAFAK